MAADLSAISEESMYDNGEEAERSRPRRPSALMAKFEQTIMRTDHRASESSSSLTPMTVSFDVIIKYRFSSSKRLLTLDLEDMKMIQQVSGHKTKENSCNEVDVTSFEQPNGPNDGLLVFRLVSARSGSTSSYERSKQFQFTSPEDSLSFMENLTLAARCGAALKRCFNILDRDHDKFVSAEDVAFFAEQDGVDVPLDKSDAEFMVDMGDSVRRNMLDFGCFFGIFLKSTLDFTNAVRAGNGSGSNLGGGGGGGGDGVEYDENMLLKTLLDQWFEMSTMKKTQQTHEMASMWNNGMSAKGNMLTQLQMSFRGIVPLLPGEKVIRTMDRTRWRGESVGEKEFLGTLRLTNYRLHFMRSGSNMSAVEAPPAFNVLSVPLGTVNRLELAQARSGLRQEIVIACKDQRLIRIAIEADVKVLLSLLERIRLLAFPQDLEATFATAYKPTFKDRWDLFDPHREYERIGLTAPGNTTWKKVVQDFKTGVNVLSPTYPSVFVVPASLDDNQVRSAAGYRSKQRMPAACWMHPDTGAVLTRSSQPMAGVSAKRNADDIMLLEQYRLAGRGHHQPANLEIGTGHARLAQTTVKVNAGSATPRPFYIADCRGQLAATGNRLQGKGAEKVSNYTATGLSYCDILNIHTMRESQSALATLVMPVEDVDPNSAPAAAAGDANYLSRLEATGWMRHLSLVLSASMWCAKKLTFEGASVLVHCSDGWDRTAQVCSNAQLMLDPYYRTIEGFAVLIEKEWLSFGHKFQDRVAHGSPDYNSQERSPIFIQWVDTVWQIIRQAPKVFEFDARLLVFVADHLYSCLFGNFFGNCERFRTVEVPVKNTTVSIWSYVLAHADKFTNPDFEPTAEPVWPKCQMQDMRLWERYYLRHNPDAHPIKFSGELWIDDYGDSAETLAEDAAPTSPVSQEPAIRPSSITRDRLSDPTPEENGTKSEVKREAEAAGAEEDLSERM